MFSNLFRCCDSGLWPGTNDSPWTVSPLTSCQWQLRSMDKGWLVESDYVRAECLILQIQIRIANSFDYLQWWRTDATGDNRNGTKLVVDFDFQLRSSSLRIQAYKVRTEARFRGLIQKLNSTVWFKNVYKAQFVLLWNWKQQNRRSRTKSPIWQRNR